MTDTQARARVWTLCLAALVLVALTGPLAALLTSLVPASSTTLIIWRRRNMPRRAAPTRRNLFLMPGGEVSDLSRLGRIYQSEAARLLDAYPNARARGQLHSLDDMIVKDLARTYPTACGPRVAAGHGRGELAHPRAHIVAHRRLHAPDGTQGMGELGTGAGVMDAWRGAAAAARADQTPGLAGTQRRCWRTCCRSKGAGVRPEHQGRRRARP